MGLQRFGKSGLERLSASLCPRLNRFDSVVKDGFDPWLRDRSQALFHLRWGKAVFNLAEEVGNCIVFSLLIFEGEVVVSQLTHPTLTGCVQGGGGEDVGKGIVVGSDNKHHLVVPVGIKVLMELFGHGPLEGQKVLLVRMVPLLHGGHHPTSIGDGVVMAIFLFL